MRFRRSSQAMRVSGVVFITLLVSSIALATRPSVKLVREEMTPEQARLRTGHEMYVALCASCHGVDGKGDGPARPALVVPPPDLTALAQRNDGVFPAIRTLNVILGDREIVAHGSREMPVWEGIFRRTGGSPAVARHRAYTLNHYLRSLQAAAAVEARAVKPEH